MLLNEILNTAVLAAIRKRYYEQQHLSIRRQFDSADCQFIRSIAPPPYSVTPFTPCSPTALAHFAIPQIVTHNE